MKYGAFSTLCNKNQRLDVMRLRLGNWLLVELTIMIPLLLQKSPVRRWPDVGPGENCYA